MNMRPVWLGNNTHGGRCDASSVTSKTLSFWPNTVSAVPGRFPVWSYYTGACLVHLLLIHWLRCRYSAGTPNLPVTTRGIEKNHMGPKRQDIQDAKLLTTIDGPVLWAGFEELPGMRCTAGYANLQFDPTRSTGDIIALHLGANTSTVFFPLRLRPILLLVHVIYQSRVKNACCHIGNWMYHVVQNKEFMNSLWPHPQQQ